MRILRSAMAWAFLFIAAIYVWLCVLVVREPVSPHRHYHTSPFVHRSPIFGAFLGLAILFGIAGWAVLRKKSSARGWGLAASIVALLPLVAFAFDPYYLYHLSAWILSLPGFVGVIAFARRWTDHPSSKSRALSPIQGDGTNNVVNKLVWVAGIAAALEGITPWYRWAAVHGLPPAQHWLSWPQLAVVVLAIVLIHESGHALTGMALDMKLSGAILGPLHWWVSYGKWKFTLKWGGFLTFAGAVALVPTKMADYHRRKILMVAAGPLASIGTGLLAMLALLTAPGRPWANAWQLLMYFAMDSILIGALNLVPFGSGGRYSDGAKLYQLLSKGCWREYHWLLGMMGCTTVSPMRPRDYDFAMLQRVAGSPAGGHDEMLMHLAEYAYRLDRNELAEAGLAIEKAELFCAESGFNPPSEWCGVLVFGHAFLRHDAVAARRWWERLEAHQAKKKNEARWISLSALLWSENRLDDAVEAWEKAAEWTRGLPGAGLWEAERSALDLLRQALDEAMQQSRVVA
jgi:hypothetical protein